MSTKGSTKQIFGRIFLFITILFAILLAFYFLFMGLGFISHVDSATIIQWYIFAPLVYALPAILLIGLYKLGWWGSESWRRITLISLMVIQILACIYMYSTLIYDISYWPWPYN